MNTTAPAPAALKKDFEDLIALFHQLTDASNELNKLNSSLNDSHLANVRLHTDTYTALQTKIGEANAAIEVIGERNPQWFAEKANLETPYGSVKRTTSTALQVADEAITITLIKAAGREKDFLVTTTAISLESLKKLSDDELKKYGVLRKTTHNFNPEPAAIDLGKAVKAVEKSAKAAAKAAKKAVAS